MGTNVMRASLRGATESITGGDSRGVRDYLHSTPSEGELTAAHEAATDAADRAERARLLGDAFETQTGWRSPELDTDSSKLDEEAAVARATASKLNRRRQCAVSRAQRDADAGLSVDRLVRDLSPYRGTVARRTLSPVSASRVAGVAVAATRRTRTCGGGRPAARASRTASGGGGGSGSGDSDGSSSPSSRADARRIGGVA